MLMVFPVSGSNPRYIWSIVLSLKQKTGDHMYTDEAEAIIASQPPEAVATGELMVLKNTIKRKVSGPKKSIIAISKLRPWQFMLPCQFR